MADPDIPIAYATTDPSGFVPVAPPPSHAPGGGRPSLAQAQTATGRSSRVMLPKQKSKVMGRAEVTAMQEQGFTKGLAEAMTRNNAAFPLRIWVVDNSGSMAQNDGHRIVETAHSDNVKIVGCTRWREIQETVNYHAQMAALLQAPTVFRMLNDPGAASGPQQFSVCERGMENIDEDVTIALQCMQNTTPGGVTPLAQHVREIRENVTSMWDDLRRDGTKVAIVLATDGLPTDYRGICSEAQKRDFVTALRSLEGLPVWVVIRLCTDEDEVVNFYNDLDSQLELSLEVLDDFVEEASEVNENNPWLNYGLALHRCREMGYHNRLFDLLDERMLTVDELRDFFFLLFGASAFDGVPDAQADWKGFCKSVSAMLKKEKKQWNPRTKKVEPWIDMKKLQKCYKKGNCTIM
jgi:Mg-chelatase subunit ChlD|eukprot:CAMPEP_0195291550 /NCGR_PEP_ID=MMETSP0707-20130614/7860_1 /TAXON_ID=33640 /ORGANISM="Asterionellopsis glacialis, Strain CCMP134" /LENGTH=406 /DNA_ID=CAMNT_0040351879 /DNA_START=36 /DNA_END=1256 /DNA_ORIENTATION=+